MSVKSFRDLTVWQKSMDLTQKIYEISDQLPSSEKYGLTSQIQRCAVSIPSNIAEGSQRNNRKEFKQFCGIAYGSSAELETQLILIKRLHDLENNEANKLLIEVQKMLRQLINKLTTTN